MGRTKTSITPEKRKTMPPRGKGKKSLMLKAIRAVCDDESKFLEDVVKIGLGGIVEIGKDADDKSVMEYKPANTMLLNLVLNRIEPPLKATYPMVEFEFTKESKPHIQAAEVMKAVSDGQLSPDIGNMFIQSIKAMIDIEEGTNLKERIEEIEKNLGIVSE